MAETPPKFLLGYGEKLQESIPPPPKRMTKSHPYTFEEAKEWLSPQAAEVASTLDALPDELVPDDMAVAVLTLHPAYLAKTHYPGELLHKIGVEAVGSRAREILPRKSTRGTHTGPIETTDLYVSGTRSCFRQFAQQLGDWTQKEVGAKKIIEIEDMWVENSEQKVRLWTDAQEPVVEVVLHYDDLGKHHTLGRFEAYLASLGLRTDMDRRIQVGGLCFLPLRAPRSLIFEMARFTFVRLARELPRLRSFHPAMRVVQGRLGFGCEVPQALPLDPGIRVAVFDGGMPDVPELRSYVTAIDAPGSAQPVGECLDHGLAVTSALLFGSVRHEQPLPVPYAHVDHYRVLDEDTGKDDPYELWDVLERIKAVMENRTYSFVNLSIGPSFPVEDNDVHVWTAYLDAALAKGRCLATIAVGNSGDLDSSSGNARVQVPADCVNALSVGACDRLDHGWRRASYSSVGPGRRPGIVKPDAVAFGGSSSMPFWVLDRTQPGLTRPVAGTSFAAPAALRSAIGIRAHFGEVLSPVALKSLVINACADGGHDKTECGWGRLPETVQDFVVCPEGSVRVVYQGTVEAGRYVRVPVPMPATEEPIEGAVTLTATFCFLTDVDPEDPCNYTRAGLDIVWRPHAQKRAKEKQLYPNPQPFFEPSDFYLSEAELRRDARKWETTLHGSVTKRGKSLMDPMFQIHHNAREGGRPARGASPMSYALVLTVSCPQMPDLYDQVLARYRTILEPLRPVFEIPITTSV